MRAIALSAVLTLVATVSANDYPEVSRVGKQILQLTEVTTPGFATPAVLFNKVKNATDEPKYKSYLTPLGKRQ